MFCLAIIYNFSLLHFKYSILLLPLISLLHTVTCTTNSVNSDQIYKSIITNNYVNQLHLTKTSYYDGSSRAVNNFIVSINRQEQEMLLKEAAKNCSEKIRAFSNYSRVYLPKANHCPANFDSIVCWPETPINDTVYLPCPDYLDKFNIRSKEKQLFTSSF